MSHLTKHSPSTLSLWLRLGRLLTLTGVISLLAALSLASLGACVGTPQPPVEVSLPDTPSPTSTLPPLMKPSTSTNSITRTAPTSDVMFDLQDLIPIGGVLTNIPTSITVPVMLGVQNQTSTPAPAFDMYVYDGNPRTGGELMFQPSFTGVVAADPDSPISRAGTVSKTFAWDVRGKAGEHQFYYYACPAGGNLLTTTCASWNNKITFPRFVWDIEIANSQQGLEFGLVQIDDRFTRGDKVLIRRYAINLTADETFAFTMTSTIFKGVELLEQVLTEDHLSLAPGQVFEQIYEYDTSQMVTWGAGVYLDIDGLQSQFPNRTDRGTWEKSTGFTFPLDAYFIATPLTGQSPLTVTFIDNSFGTKDGGKLESWLWSFGDGLTSTDRLPPHVYTSPGRYGVALTATTIGNSLWTVRQLSRMGAITDPTIFTRTF